MEHNITQKTAAPDHPIADEIAERYSPRMFAWQDLDQEAIERLLEAARWAASSRNQQPWRFIYAYQGTLTYSRMFNCLAEANRRWVKNAPVLLITAIKTHFDNGKENYHALHDLGLAMGNMTAQAQHMGIGLHHMAGIDWKEAEEQFSVPEGYHIVTAVAIGYYGGDPEQLPEDLKEQELAIRNRKPLSQIARRGQFPERK